MTIKNVSYLILASFLFVFSYGVVSYATSSYFVKDIQIDFEIDLPDIYLEEETEELNEETIVSTDITGVEIEETDKEVELNDTETTGL